MNFISLEVVILQKYNQQSVSTMFTIISAILGLFVVNESNFLINFLIIAYQIKFKYSLLTSSFI